MWNFFPIFIILKFTFDFEVPLNQKEFGKVSKMFCENDFIKFTILNRVRSKVDGRRESGRSAQKWTVGAKVVGRAKVDGPFKNGRSRKIVDGNESKLDRPR